MSGSFKGTDSYKDWGSGSGLDQMVKINASDANANFLDQKIIAGANVSIALVSDDFGNFALMINGPGSEKTVYKQATFNEMTATHIGHIRQDGSIVDGVSSGTRAFTWISPMSMVIKQIGASFRQVGGQPWRFVVYNRHGELLATSARFTPIEGYQNVNLQSSVFMAANQRVYIGYWSGDPAGNTKVELMGGCLVDNTAPLIQLSDINEAPAVMGTGLGQTPFRPWLTFGS